MTQIYLYPVCCHPLCSPEMLSHDGSITNLMGGQVRKLGCLDATHLIGAVSPLV